MASLTGNAIKDSYLGLIKTDDNAIVGATEKQITDGAGNAIPMTMGTSGVSFTGDADFSAATVTGLPEAGLESGTGANSLKNADSLVTTPATANGSASIALGNGATADSNSAIAIGPAANGDGAQAVAIGNSVVGSQDSAVAIGNLAQVWAIRSVAVGRLSKACATCSVAIGTGAQVTSSGTGAVALGTGVTAAKADTVSVKELETQTAGGGIYLTTPDGLAQPKLTVDNSCALLVDGSPVGGGGAAGLVSGTGADSMQSAASLTTLAANASGVCSIALGDAANAQERGAIAIGRAAVANGYSFGIFGGVAIGDCSTARPTNVAIGACAKSAANDSVSIGFKACGTGASTGSVTVGHETLSGNGGVAVGRIAKACDNGVAIGNAACTTIAGATAIGANVVAAKADTVTVKELETCVAGGGIYLTTPDGLAQPKLTVNNSSELLIDGNPVGGGDPFNPTTLTGASQSLDLGSFNFFDGGTLADETTLTFTNAPTEASFGYTFKAGPAAWKLEGSSYTFKNLPTGSLTANPRDIFWKSDGTQLWLVGDNTIYEYTTTTAFDLSTATYSNNSFSVSTQTGQAISLFWKSDGSVFYVLDYNGDTIYQYSTTTAWDITAASYDNISLDISAQEVEPAGLFWKPDGTQFWLVGGLTNDDVYQYDVTTAWDLSTASYSNVKSPGTLPEGNAGGLFFKSDGTKLFVSGRSSDKVHQMSMSTPWDVSTLTNDNISYLIAEDTFSYGLFFKPDGTQFYVVGDGTNTVYQYYTGASSVVLPTNIENPPQLEYLTNDIVTYNFYTLDGGTTYTLINENSDKLLSAGLINGDGNFSIVSAPGLTLNPATAGSISDIVLGDGATSTASTVSCNIVIGTNAAGRCGAIVMGRNTISCRDNSIAIGNTACSTASAYRGVAIGNTAIVSNGDAISIGTSACASGLRTVAIGNTARTVGACSVAIGRAACSTGACSVALGDGVTAAKADTVTVKELETCVAGGGVIMTTPDGLNQYKITVDNSGNLVSTLVV